MAITASDQELIELEERFWTALRDGDVEAASAMTAPQCIVTGAQGVATIDPAQFASMMEHGTWELHAYAFSDVQVLRLRDDVVVVAYKVREELTVDGRPLVLEASDTSTWVRDGGVWRCAVHTEAPAGDPFGRVRTIGGNETQ